MSVRDQMYDAAAVAADDLYKRKDKCVTPFEVISGMEGESNESLEKCYNRRFERDLSNIARVAELILIDRGALPVTHIREMDKTF